MAYGMSIVSSLVTTEVIEVEEFSEMARKYKVGPVPKAVLNDRVEFVGSAPEPYLLEKVLSLNSNSGGSG
jgi:hypothetical protein